MSFSKKIKSFIFLILIFKSSIMYINCHIFDIDLEPKMEGINALQRIKINMDQYRTKLEDIRNDKRSNNGTIVVFPEYGLTGITNEVEKYAIEISEENEVLTDLRAMALEHNMTLVSNLLEKSNNNYYNTIIVYDNQGRLISKYRKINLIDEPKLTPGNAPVEVTLDVVTYGIMTVNDILFKKPSETLNVNSFLIPNSRKNNQLPFEIGDSLKYNYIHSKNNKYHHRFTRQSSIANNTAENKFTYLFNNSNAKYASDILPLNSAVTIKVNHYTCMVNVNYTDNTESNFYLKVILFDGKDIEVAGKTQNKVFCSFFHCETNSIDTCGNIINENIKFHSINVTLKSDINLSTDLIRPTTLRSNFKPVENYSYSARSHSVNLKSENLPDGTLVFGVLKLSDSKWNYSSGNKFTNVPYFFYFFLIYLLTFI